MIVPGVRVVEGGVRWGGGGEVVGLHLSRGVVLRLG